jgi:hypothetical protein
MASGECGLCGVVMLDDSTLFAGGIPHQHSRDCLAGTLLAMDIDLHECIVIVISSRLCVHARLSFPRVSVKDFRLPVKRTDFRQSTGQNQYGLCINHELQCARPNAPRDFESFTAIRVLSNSTGTGGLEKTDVLGVSSPSSQTVHPLI